MKTLRPFLSYYGSKWRAAPLYPVPRYSTIIEPFAGAAGYSIRHHRKRVILVDKNPIICEVWRYLINADPVRILSLPDIGEETIDDPRHAWLSQAEKWLIGFWLNSAATFPRKQPGAWARRRPNSAGYWGKRRRQILADQVGQIRHWRVIEGDYWDAPDIEATWYIDPPYQNMGKHYPCKVPDFNALGDWCRTRKGQTIVCENMGADWLPFRFLADIKAAHRPGMTGKSAEAIWTNDTGESPC